MSTINIKNINDDEKGWKRLAFKKKLHRKFSNNFNTGDVYLIPRSSMD